MDGEPAAFLLYGALPAWRDFASGMTDGEDVRQLERNLRALGYDPGTVDDDWDWRRPRPSGFQRDRELDDDGTLARGEVVFRPGATRIGEAKGEVGEVGAGPAGRGESPRGAEGRRRSSTRAASSSRAAGDKVTVELPTGDEVAGASRRSARSRARRARTSDPTVDVTITLRGRRGALDQAPVDVGFAVERRKDALAVPVKALLARQGGGYALELPDGAQGRRSRPGCTPTAWSRSPATACARA